MFFFYGHFYQFLDYINFQLSNTILISIFVIILLSLSLFIIKIKSNFNDISKILNYVALTILLISFVNFLSFDLENSSLENYSIVDNYSMVDNLENNISPNVIYIILDAYGGNDALKKFYNFDNSDFIQELEKREFTIIPESRSNYAYTYLSLASTLNLDYHMINDNDDSNNYLKMYQAISKNVVMENFKNLGYHVINFDSGWGTTREMQSADETLCNSMNSIGNSQIITSILEYSILKPVYSKIFSQDRREQVLCQFDGIPEVIKKSDKPIFIFAHIVSPHKPYLFKANGESNEVSSLEMGEINYSIRNFDYIEQLQFVNMKTLTLIDEIFTNSKIPPIIIIQSDHGSEYPVNSSLDEKIEEKMSNFNSFYLPNGGESILYDEMTSVNSFRLIFNHYFGGKYEILDDRSFWSDSNPFQNEPPFFIDVTEKLSRK